MQDHQISNSCHSITNNLPGKALKVLGAVCLASMAFATPALAARSQTVSPAHDYHSGYGYGGRRPGDPAVAAQIITINRLDQLDHEASKHDNVYIHVLQANEWYYKTASYLLGIEGFRNIGKVAAPAKAVIVVNNFGEPERHRRTVPIRSATAWPRINAVWVIGAQGSPVFGMRGAPRKIPLGTAVFGSTQTYEGYRSVFKLAHDRSQRGDANRIQGLFRFNAGTMLGGHSAGSSVARRIAINLRLQQVALYGTPDYPRKDGQWVTREHRLHATVINNKADPVTNILHSRTGLSHMGRALMSHAHNYSNHAYLFAPRLVAYSGTYGPAPVRRTGG